VDAEHFGEPRTFAPSAASQEQLALMPASGSGGFAMEKPTAILTDDARAHRATLDVSLNDSRDVAAVESRCVTESTRTTD